MQQRHRLDQLPTRRAAPILLRHPHPLALSGRILHLTGPAPKLRWSAATSDQTGRPRRRPGWPAEQRPFGLDSCISCNSRDFIDRLAIGPAGVFVIDSNQWTGSVHQGADGLVWHNHYRLDRTLETVRWEAETVSRLLGTRAAALVCVHGAHVQGGGVDAQIKLSVVASDIFGSPAERCWPR
jgi:Nuclease-related domain